MFIHYLYLILRDNCDEIVSKKEKLYKLAFLGGRGYEYGKYVRYKG